MYFRQTIYPSQLTKKNRKKYRDNDQNLSLVLMAMMNKVRIDMEVLMNVYSIGIFGLLLCSVIVGYVCLLVQCLRQTKQIDALKAQLDIFADSSIRVAQSVDRLVQHGKQNDSMTVASRRWILQEAKTRLQNGESLLDIAAPLGLSRDEVRLLNARVH
jgi:hypothetical protein